MMTNYLLKSKEDMTDLRFGHVHGLSSLLQFSSTQFSAGTVLFVLPSFFHVETEASAFYEDIRKDRDSVTSILYLSESLIDYHQHITILSFLRFFDIVILTEPLLFQLTNETALSYALRKLIQTTALTSIVVEGQSTTIYTNETCFSKHDEDLPSFLRAIPSFTHTKKL